MNDFIAQLFSSQYFMPHGHCYLWRPEILWTSVISDGLIVLSYYSIPVTLIYFVRHRKDLVFDWIFFCFAAFIMACGTTHLVDIWTVWNPDYWLAAGVKATTALLSISTAILLIRLVPLALALQSPAALLEVNKKLQFEISERERAEQSLFQKNRELATLNSELEAFSYSVSHDLRGPLRSMDGFSLALLEDYAELIDAEGQDALHRIRNASQRMGQLIDDLLRLSNVTRAEINLQSVDLSLMANECIASISDGQKQRHVQWVVQKDMTITADKTLLQIAIQNLLQNAWKFTGKTRNAVIHVGCQQQENKIVYFISDNGVGFDAALSEHLFVAFQRLHHVTEFPGTGIGLAIVQRIISRHDGKIWVEAKPDQGATFYFSLKEISHVLPEQIHTAG